MSCPCSTELSSIYGAIGNLQTQFNYVTGNALSNYNQINLILSQQSNINSSIYSGVGNISIGNLYAAANANINGNLYVKNDANIGGNITTNRFNYNYFTVNNSALTITPPSTIRKFSFVQRFTLTAAVTSTSYNILRVNIPGNTGIIITARIVGHLYYSDTTSTGIFQENRMIIDKNNTSGDTCVSNVSNGTAITISKGTANTWTSCNMSTDLTTSSQVLINITPIFTGTQSTDASSITIDWFISGTASGTNTNDITGIQFYAGV